MKASRAAELLGSTVDGGSDPELTGVAPLDRAGPDDLAFLAQGRYLSYVPASRAGAFLVSRDLADRLETDRPRIVVENVHAALAELLPRLYPEPAVEPGIHESAQIDPDAQMGADVTVAAYAVIGAGTRLGDRVRIGAHVVLGAGCVIGDEVVLHPQVVLYPGVEIGPRTMVHAGARLGVHGFGYARTDEGNRKIPQVGGCVIGADVEIGANSTIDRGSVGCTEIGDGVKIDNLVHIGHNVRIGDHAVIVAQVGIAGTATVGARATLAGQVGVVDHVNVRDGATVASKSAVWSDVPRGETWSGIPARPHRERLRMEAELRRLTDLAARVRSLERRLDQDGAKG